MKSNSEKGFFLIVVLLLISYVSYCQDCKNDVLAAYYRFEKPLPKAKDSAAFLDYSVKTYSFSSSASNKFIVANQNFKIWVNENFVTSKGSYIDVYKDNKTIIVANKPAKIITIGFSPQSEQKKDHTTEIRLFQGSMIEHCSVSSCMKSKKNQNIKIVELIPEQRVWKNTGIAKLKFRVNSKSQQLLSASVYFFPILDDGVYQIEYFFSDTNMATKTNIFHKDIMENIFDRNGVLKAEYYGFAVFDLRKNKKN